MSPENVLLVRQSWAALEPRAGGFLADCAARLRSLDGGLDPVLADPAVVAAEVGVLVDLLDEPEQLIPRLAALGARYQALGVTARHYDLTGDAVLAALREALWPSWSDPLHDAWAEAFTLASSVMKRAGRRASGEWVAASAAVRPGTETPDR